MEPGILEYKCKKCKLNYQTYNGLWKHNKKYHNKKSNNNNAIININQHNINPVINNNQQNVPNTETTNSLACKNCKKNFSFIQSRWRHEKKCIPKTTNEITELKIEIKQEINKLKDENTKLKKLIDKKANKKTVNNNSGTIVNGNMTNNIVINKFGEETITKLNNKEITEIFNKELEGVLTFIELIKFNENIPENHNFCTTALESKYLSTYNTDTNKVDKDRKKYVCISCGNTKPRLNFLKENLTYFFDKLLNISIDKMEKLFTLNKKQFNNKKQKQIEENITNLKSLRNYDFNNKIIKEISNKMNLISYNNRDIVQNTWANKESDSDDDFQRDLDKPPTEVEEEIQKPNIKKTNMIIKQLPSDSDDEVIIDNNDYESSSDDESTITMDINKEIFMDVYKN